MVRLRLEAEAGFRMKWDALIESYLTHLACLYESDYDAKETIRIEVRRLRALQCACAICAPIRATSWLAEAA